MIRTFHSVGQGAFYSEVFEETDFIFIYDCGSDNNPELIQAEIKAAFDKRCTIDAVFISHFHADHVNGLEFLLKHCNIEHLFLPELYEEEKMSLLIQNYIDGSSEFIEKMIVNPVRTISQISQKTAIHFVSVQDEESPYDNQEVYRRSINQLSENQDINSGTILYGETPKWVFIPFNFQYSNRSRKLLNELNNRDLDIKTIDDFKRLWKNRRADIIETYNKIPGNMNTNSMVVYSGPISPPDNYYFDVLPYRSIAFHGYWNLPPYDLISFPGCMYFGDYEAKGGQKWNEFMRHYKKYWPLIGVVQIPHHGSKYNYNREINANKPLLSVISCGERNKHHHPHAATLREILFDGGTPVIVTERSGSKLLCKIWGA